MKHNNTTKTLFKSLVAMVALCGLAAACEEHDDMLDARMKVGNIVLADNSIVSPAAYDSTQKAVGVICCTRGDTAWVVAKDELGSYTWADSIATVGGVANDFTSLCGLENTSAIVDAGVGSRSARAASAYQSAVSSWFLPSAGELRALSANLAVVSRSMRIIGGDGFDDGQYISSSQDGSSDANSKQYYYAVSIGSGRVASSLKSIPGIVRPFLRIE